VTEKNILRNILRLAIILFACALPASAQFLGYTSPQTVNQNVFTNANCATSPLKSANLQNVGQSIHIVTYSVSGDSATNIVRVMGGTDGVNFSQISDDGMGLASAFSGTLVGYGSYPFIQVWVVGGNSGCVATINYQGTSVGATNPGTGSVDVTAYQKLVFLAQQAGTSTSTNFLPPYGNMGGVLLFLGGSTPAGSTITIQGNSGGPTFTFTTPANNNASFVVPSMPVSNVTVSYNSGGASSSPFSLIYIFAKPGNLPILPQCEKTAIINTAAAGPTSIIAATGSAIVRVCSISVSSATAEAVDFQQGTGTNCATGNSQLTGLNHLAANTPLVESFPGGGLLSLPSNAVCIHLSGANQTDGTITYSQY
jgi:hypothetical protein